jgi:hypothetical protein
VPRRFVEQFTHVISGFLWPQQDLSQTMIGIGLKKASL